MKRILVLFGLTLSVLGTSTFTSCEKYMPYLNEEITTDCNTALYRIGTELIYTGSMDLDLDTATLVCTDVKEVNGVFLAKVFQVGSEEVAIGMVNDNKGNLYQLGETWETPLKIYDINSKIGDSIKVYWNDESANIKDTATFKVKSKSVNFQLEGKTYTKGVEFAVHKVGFNEDDELSQDEPFTMTYVCGLGIVSILNIDGENLFKLVRYKY